MSLRELATKLLSRGNESTHREGLKRQPAAGMTTALILCFLKGLKDLFPKIWSYSLETVDKVGKWQDPTYFVSKLPYLQMPGPQS